MGITGASTGSGREGNQSRRTSMSTGSGPGGGACDRQFREIAGILPAEHGPGGAMALCDGTCIPALSDRRRLECLSVSVCSGTSSHSPQCSSVSSTDATDSASPCVPSPPQRISPCLPPKEGSRATRPLSLTQSTTPGIPDTLSARQIHMATVVRTQFIVLSACGRPMGLRANQESYPGHPSFVQPEARRR